LKGKQIANKKTTCIELEPELDACIETKARREYNRVLSELLEKGEEKELAERLDILRLFLESADFNKLRSESEKHLVAGKTVRFILYLEKGRPRYEMKVNGGSENRLTGINSPDVVK
jgi:uncharacterized protein YerC